MTTAQQVLDVARRELGQSEQPRGSNRTKYGTWFGFQGPWCSMFVCWVLNMAGAGALVKGAKTAKGSAYSGDILDHFRRPGRVSMTPQSGDLVVWDWPGVGTANDHIGFVEYVYGNGKIGTIEGNSPGSGFVFDVVGRHVRDVRRSVRGYCHPAYSAASGPAPGPPPAPKGRFLMALTDAQQGDVYNMLQDLQQKANFDPRNTGGRHPTWADIVNEINAHTDRKIAEAIAALKP